MMDGFFNLGKNSIPRIGDLAPAFRSVTTQGTIYFPADYFGKWVILFCYPGDFTPQSFLKFMEFATLHNEFNALNCELIGLAIDRLRRRIAGFHSIREKTEYRGLKDIDIKFPMIEDITREVAIKYGIIQPDESNTKAVRAVFFIDPECMIRAINYYPPSLDLDFNELKQVIVSLQTEDDAISPTTKSDGKAKELLEIKKEVKKSNEWFFCTRELSEEKVINVN